MAQEKFAARLSAGDRSQLEGLIRRGQHSARVINRERILLKTDAGWSASQVAAPLDTSQRTVFRTKRRYADEGLHGVLHDHPQANRYRKLDDRGQAHLVSITGLALIALACSDAPEGHDHWTLRLLADKVVELGVAPSLSHETVPLRLKKHPQTLAKATNVLHQAPGQDHISRHRGRHHRRPAATELGPTTPVDMAPAQGVGINLPATGASFTGWIPHAEVGGAAAGSQVGGEGLGEHGAGRAAGGETHDTGSERWGGG